MVWILVQDVGGDDCQCSDELCICVSNLVFSGLSGLQLFVDKLVFFLGEFWCIMQSGGKINLLVFDIFLQVMEKMCFQVQWSDLVWKQWKFLLGVEYFFGSLNGSVEYGELCVYMVKVLMLYVGVFCVLLEIVVGEVMFSWVKNDKGFMFDGCDIDVQVIGVCVCGGFCYL